MKRTNYPDSLAIAAGQNLKEREYWLNKFSGIPIKSSFFSGKKNGNGNGKTVMGRLEFNLPPDIYSLLTRVSKGSEYALNIILQAGLILLLHKYTSNTDIVTGTPIYKQDTEGEFINTVLPLRNALEHDLTFKQLLLRVKQTLGEAVENQDYPLEILADDLNLPYGENDFPLFDVGVLLENIHHRKYFERIRVNTLFSFLQSESRIDGILEYNSSIFEKTAVEKIISHLYNLLERALGEPDSPVSAIDILSGEERKQLLVDFNNAVPGAVEDRLIHQWFEEQVERTPGNIALVYKDEQITYNMLNERANRLAHLLRARGVRGDTLVGLMFHRSVEMIVGILGILKAGGAYLPIDPGYPVNRVLRILEDSKVEILLTRGPGLDGHSFTALQGLRHARVEPHMTSVRPQSDFDRLPHPDRSLIDVEKYSHYIGHAMVRHAVSIQGTRGCPYRCAYCHRTMEMRNVARSAENIFEEVNYYYRRGVRRFAFVDEIFNLDARNSMRFYRLILKHKMDVQLFFPNGMRADRLTREYIDLMVEAGTVNVGLALETASPRLQKLIRKNLDIEKLRENAEYFCAKYPNIIVELFTMHGFPTESEEEALATLDFIKSLKWIHFPYVFLLKIHPSTEMMKLALESGISRDAIERSMTSAFHEIPETLPYPKSFTRQYVARFMNEYFLSKERLLHVLPYQMKIASEKELVAKYDNYLPAKIKSFNDIIENVGISPGELGDARLIRDDASFVPDYDSLRRSRTIVKKPGKDAFRILLLDLSVQFSTENQDILHGEITEPLGLMYLLTYLRETFKERIDGKMYKSKIDFDDFEALKKSVCDFKPHLIGIRTLSYFKDFFHKTAALIKEWGITAPIIAGGPYGTSDYKLVLQDPNIALTVLKEGELTLAELVEKMMANHNRLPEEEVLRDIPGIAYIKKQDKPLLKKGNRDVILVDKIPGSLDRQPVDNPGIINKTGDLVYMLYTSGTTGVPKGVMLEHRNLANLIRFVHHHTNIDCGSVLQFQSIGFDVSFQEVFSTLLSGGRLSLIDLDTRANISELFKTIEKNNIKTLFLPASFLKFIFNREEYSDIFPRCVEHIQAAGEQLVINEALGNYLKKNNVYLHNHYGPTEAHVVTALTLNPAEEIPGSPSIGKPVLNTSIYILDENKKCVPVGVSGGLYIGGTQVGRGYFGREELTNEKFMENPFKEGDRLYFTGDLARWLPDGNIEFSGRSDLQVKIRGFRVELGEIESQLLKIDTLTEAVVFDREDASGNTYLCAYVVAAGNAGDRLDTSRLKNMLSDELPDYMIPSYIVQVDGIPLTANGKIDRKSLPDPEIRTGDEYVAPADGIEKKMAAVWAEILDMEKEVIGAGTDFFQLGGHSLKATMLVSRIHKEWDVKVSLGEIFKSPTIRGLAGYIEKAGKDKYFSIEPAGKRNYYSLSSAQKRLYFRQQVDETGIAYNMPMLSMVEGNIDPERLENTFKMLISRHESLRTSFEVPEAAGEPVQKIHEQVDFKIEYYDIGPGEKKLIKSFVHPFDLSRAPLLRVGLAKTGEDRHLLMVDMHHIISDGVSHLVLAQDFRALYVGEELPRLRLQYKDYSEWWNKKREENTGWLERQENYWLKRFEGEIPVLGLTGDYDCASDPAHPSDRDTWRGGAVHFEIDTPLTGKVRELVSTAGTTLYIVLLAAYTILLSKYTGRDDIVVTSGIAGRNHADLEKVIGMFVNMLPMRNRPYEDRSFSRFLEEVKENTLDAFKNQDYQFDELIMKLGIEREYGRNPLFEAGLTLQNLERREITLPGLKLIPCDYDKSTSEFDLNLLVSENDDSISMRLEYAAALFKKTTVEKIAADYIEILAQSVENPDKKLGDITVSHGLATTRSVYRRDDYHGFTF